MAITIIGPSATGTHSGSGEGVLTIEDLTIVSGLNRMMLVSAHTRGNAGFSEITSMVMTEVDGGATVATFTEVNDVDSDNIIHVETFCLLDDDFPPNGTYDIVITTQGAPTQGAFQIAAFVNTFQGVKQQIPGSSDTYGSTNNIGSPTFVVQATPAVVINVDGSLVADNTSGDDTGGGATASPTGPTRAFVGRLAAGPSGAEPLRTAVAGTFFDTDDSPINDLAWGYSSTLNRIAMGTVVFEPASGSPSSSGVVNVYLWGANH